MTDKDVPKTISRLFGLGRNLRARLPKSLSGKPAAAGWQPQAVKVALLLGLSLLLALLLSPRISEPLRKYRVGDVAQENVKAIGDLLVEDVETTAKKQQELMTQVPPVFDLQEQQGEQVQQRLQKAMEYMRRVSQEAAAQLQPPACGKSAGKAVVPYKVFLEHKSEFDRLLDRKSVV